MAGEKWRESRRGGWSGVAPLSLRMHEHVRVPAGMQNRLRCPRANSASSFSPTDAIGRWHRLKTPSAVEFPSLTSRSMLNDSNSLRLDDDDRKTLEAGREGPNTCCRTSLCTSLLSRAVIRARDTANVDSWPSSKLEDILERNAPLQPIYTYTYVYTYILYIYICSYAYVKGKTIEPVIFLGSAYGYCSRLLPRSTLYPSILDVHVYMS